MKPFIIKHERREEKEDARGRVRSRTVTEWAVVESGGGVISTHDRKRDAIAALAADRGKD